MKKEWFYFSSGIDSRRNASVKTNRRFDRERRRIGDSSGGFGRREETILGTKDFECWIVEGV